jgi:hypothetical protein
MSKFLVKFETYLVFESEYHDSEEAFQDALEIGSRCWESELVKQLAKENDEDISKSVCNLGYRSRIEVVKMVAADYPDLPEPNDCEGV